MRYVVCALVALTAVGWADARVQTRTVVYSQGSSEMQGTLAWDDAMNGKRPGVLVAPDWMGEGPFTQRKAADLARLGYVALSLDVYGKGVHPSSPAEAGQMSGALKGNRPLLRDRMKAALDALRGSDLVDRSRIAAIGFCFGGTAVLELARSGADVVGIVTFHGGLDTPTPQDARNIKGKVLVLHGADDPNANLKQVMDFNEEMKNAGVDYQIVLYGHAVHSFTNPAAGNDNSKGAAYNEKADRRSWVAMQGFFAELFGSPARR